MSQKQMRALMEQETAQKAERDAQNAADARVVAAHFKWAGYTSAIPIVATTLGPEIEGTFMDRMVKTVRDKMAAIEKCRAAKTHWEPKNFQPRPGQKPKCNRCGARIDVTPDKDTGLMYREWCELLEGYAKGITPGRVPNAGELKDAGYFQPDHSVPGRIKPPFSAAWHPIINLSRHDIVGLSAAVRLARFAGALPSHGGGPDVLASDQNESGRRWSF